MEWAKTTARRDKMYCTHTRRICLHIYTYIYYVHIVWKHPYFNIENWIRITGASYYTNIWQSSVLIKDCCSFASLSIDKTIKQPQNPEENIMGGNSGCGKVWSCPLACNIAWLWSVLLLRGSKRMSTNYIQPHPGEDHDIGVIKEAQFVMV